MGDGLVLPVLGTFRVSSGFGPRAAPMRGASTNHRGIDIPEAIGSPVIAPTDLKITYAGQKTGFGNYIEGVDGSGRAFGFGHLSGVNVRPGQTVAAGSTIGASGNSGVSTGPHLHFQVKDANGKYLNPLDVLKGAAPVVGNILGKTGDVGIAAKDAALAGLDNALGAIPGIGQIWTASKAAGVPDIFTASMGECGINPICYLQKWFRDTDFIPRFILFQLAIIFIAGAIYLLGKPVFDPMIKNAASAAAKAALL